MLGIGSPRVGRRGVNELEKDAFCGRDVWNVPRNDSEAEYWLTLVIVKKNAFAISLDLSHFVLPSVYFSFCELACNSERKVAAST